MLWTWPAALPPRRGEVLTRARILEHVWDFAYEPASNVVDHGGARIRALREELGRERLVCFFATADQLAQQVSVAVTRQLAARQEPMS
jgi:DNA-binding response OmpR family regulator